MPGSCTNTVYSYSKNWSARASWERSVGTKGDEAADNNSQPKRKGLLGLLVVLEAKDCKVVSLRLWQLVHRSSGCWICCAVHPSTVLILCNSTRQNQRPSKRTTSSFRVRARSIRTLRRRLIYSLNLTRQQEKTILELFDCDSVIN